VQLHARRPERAEPVAAIPLGQAQFDGVYETYVQRIYGFVFSHVGNREDAEDVTSQVFIKVYKNLASFEGRGSLQGWLFQIARMAVADFWRERYKLAAVPLAETWDIPEPEASPEQDQPAREARVKQLLDQLPDNYREVLVQRFFLRSSIAETARTMGVTEANARVLQFRALRRAAEVARREAGDGRGY
jgi:RNA polymerase sigma-70 factor (ECF subfamily)